MRRLLALVGAVTLTVAGLALAGCAGASAGGDPTNAVVPPSTEVPADPGEVSAAWLDDGRLIGIVTFGSSSCVPASTGSELGPTGSLTVTLQDPDAACTKDYAPRVTIVEVPEGVDPAADLDIELSGDYVGATDLDGVAGLSPGGETSYLPTAGWTGEDDQLIVLTWGSSGCPPVVASVAPTGPAAVTVVFETPPADQVCTADIAPRATLVAASGLEDDVAAQLTLSGGADFTNPVTIPVYGAP